MELENIDDPWQSPFFGTNTIDEINGQNSDIWMDRAIVDFLGQSEKYG
ncbi:hypothetical protein FACS1894218_2810 [Bacilli bacterium]|nr:hypothetical protein FACS1894218_2810 [Bacilli bacterium]